MSLLLILFLHSQSPGFISIPLFLFIHLTFSLHFYTLTLHTTGSSLWNQSQSEDKKKRPSLTSLCSLAAGTLFLSLKYHSLLLSSVTLSLSLHTTHRYIARAFSLNPHIHSKIRLQSAVSTRSLSFRTFRFPLAWLQGLL